jgi:hypothetical protein
MISTRDLSALPDVDTLRRLMQSLAMLDAILSPEWESRYFSFNSRWAAGGQMGSMRNGSGDHYFALFTSAGCWLKGFDHEAPMSPFSKNPPQLPAGVFDGVPDEFRACLTEPAFVRDETTFCIWRRHADRAWQRGPVMFPSGEDDPDGSAGLLQYLDARPETYAEWAAEYYERDDLPLAAIKAIYAHQPLDERLVRFLNADFSLRQLQPDIQEIGYPAA